MGTSINKLIDIITKAKKSKSKEVRIDINTLDSIQSELLELLSIDNKRLEEINEIKTHLISVLNQKQPETKHTPENLDGGNF